MLNFFTPYLRNRIVAHRPGELRVGETMPFITGLEELHDSSAQFVVFGVCEDIGIQANLGSPGAAAAWDVFLPAFVNLQDNQFLRGKDILILGHLDFDHLMAQAKALDPAREDDLYQLRSLCAEIDSHVCSVVEKIVARGKVPILIGGGHNNALGAIKGWNVATKKHISIINIDRHADFRILEGRHSGNPFHYAWNQDYMHKYCVFGLDESYTNQFMLDQFHQNDFLNYVSLDQLLGCSGKELADAFQQVLQWLGSPFLGLEVDMDCVEYFPASAQTPSGFTLNELRGLVKTASRKKGPSYFHLCEASPDLAATASEKEMLGKALSLLAADFIKSHPKSTAEKEVHSR